MWPTYFIPAIVRDSFFFSACFKDISAPPNTVTADFPAGLRPDDLMMVIVQMDALGSQQATMPTGWNIIHSKQLFFNTVHSRTLAVEPAGSASYDTTGLWALIYKFWQSGDPLTYDFVSPANGIRACAFAVRGIDTAEPFPLLHFPYMQNLGGSVTGGFFMGAGRLPHLEGALRLDVLTDGGTLPADTDAPASEYDYPSDETVLTANVMAQPARGTPTDLVASSVAYVLRRPAISEGGNAIPSLMNNTNWTLTGMTYALATNSRGYGSPRLSTSSGTTLHQVTRSFTCAAGQTYLFSVLAGGFKAGMVIGYDVGGTLYGATFGLQAELINVLNDARCLRSRTFSAGSASGARYGVYMRFDEETTVTLLLGTTNLAGDRTYAGATIGDTLNVPWIGMQAVPSDHYIPAMNDRFTSADDTARWSHAVNPTNWARNMDATGANVFTNPRLSLSLLLKPAGAASPPVTLESNPLPDNIKLVSSTQTKSTTADTSTWYPYDNGYDYSMRWGCDKWVWPGFGGGKFYIEFTINTLSSSAADWPAFIATPGIQRSAFAGLSAFAGSNDPPYAFPSSNGFYGWTVNGKRCDPTNGRTTGGTTLAAGDIVGVAIDFENLEVKWYKNGTLDHTDTFGTSFELYPWAIGFGLSNAASNIAVQITVNAAGPFGGRKPAGFAAWDWTNE